MKFEAEISGAIEIEQALDRLMVSMPEVVEEIAQDAAEIVIDAARPTVPVHSGRAARSLRAYVTNGVGIASGGEGIDYYGMLEFGGNSGRNLQTYRAERREGRYILPAYDRKARVIENHMATRLAKAIENSGLEVT